MWSWIVQGTTYPLDDGTFAYFEAEDGAGMLPLHRLSERGPLQHGSTDRGFRMDPRILMLALVVNADTMPEYYEKREAMINAFKPLDEPGSIRWEIPGKIRQIDGHFIEGLSFASKDRIGWNHRTQVVIKCDDPAWYDPTAIAVTFALGDAGGGTPVPTPVPTPVGADRLDDYRLVQYTGILPAYPHLIRITGPITDPVITNATTGEKLDFTGYSIASGDWYDINLLPLYKTVFDNDGINRYSELTQDSSLSTWRLEADPTAPDGQNEIFVTGSGISSVTRIDITYYNRYPGF